MASSETVSEGKRKKQLFTVKELCYAAVGTVLIAVCSWISLPIGQVPFTLQTFAVCFVAGLLGLKCGLASVAVFLALGAVGVPVFHNFQGGVGVLLGTTGGYLIGFLFTAVIVGLAVKWFDRRLVPLVVSMVLGIAVCYAFGTVWFLKLYAGTNGAVALGTVMGWCVIPFLIPDACKIVLATLLVNRLSKVIKI